MSTVLADHPGRVFRPFHNVIRPIGRPYRVLIASVQALLRGGSEKCL